jgi:DNA invertase Pin-like site-specific DNA recombinase
MPTVIGYVRVSTCRQGQSGLGLAAQRQTIEEHARRIGAEIALIYEEIETGTKVSNRPQLGAALAHAKRTKATLVIAKLDRLARNVAFISSVMDAGVDFVACDNPHATRLTLHILAAVAEHEAHVISERTKAALAAAKARGQILGSPVARETAHVAREARTIQAKTQAQNVAAIIRDIERAGVTKLSHIAKALEARGVKTPRGSSTWQAVQVRRTVAMAGTAA